MPSTIMLSRRRRPPLNLLGRIRPPHKVQPITIKVRVIPKPEHRPRRTKHREHHETRHQLAPQLRFAPQPGPQKTAPHDRRHHPAVVPRQHHQQANNPTQNQPRPRHKSIARTHRRRKLHCGHHRPHKQRQKQRLGHRRCRQVQQVRVQRIKQRSYHRPAQPHQPPRKPPYAHSTRRKADHRHRRRRQARLPHAHIPNKRQHQQVRQRQPRPTQLRNPRVMRVQNAPGVPQMRDRIAIQQRVPRTVTNKQRHQRQKHTRDKHRHAFATLQRPHRLRITLHPKRLSHTTPHGDGRNFAIQRARPPTFQLTGSHRLSPSTSR